MEDDGYDALLAEEERALEAGSAAAERENLSKMKILRDQREASARDAEGAAEFGSYESHAVHLANLNQYSHVPPVSPAIRSEPVDVLASGSASPSQSDEKRLAQVQAMRYQLEYYFSQDNIVRDEYIKKVTDAKCGGVAISELSTFARVIMIARGGNRGDLIAEAVQTSKMLTLVHREGSSRTFVKAVRQYAASSIERAEGQVKSPQSGNTRKRSRFEAQSNTRNSSANQQPRNNQHTREEQDDSLMLCKYFAAGYCDRGKRCSWTHDMRLIDLVESQWMSPDDEKLVERLRTGVRQLNLPDHVGIPSSKLKEINVGVASGSKSEVPLPFDYFLVVDLEGRDEIIEFPALLMDARTLREPPGQSRFHHWVRPNRLFQGKMSVNPGVKANPKSRAVDFSVVVRDLDEWLCKQVGVDVVRENRVLVVTCGDWDMKTAVFRQCGLAGINHRDLPRYLRQWANIKVIYNGFYKTRRPVTGMKGMLYGLFGGELLGMHHLGMHDTFNIARVVARVVSDGTQMRVTNGFPDK
ncbi:putative exonuclease domain-containing protein [Porphyridium purpureum]|uniref:Putative exonuclease domain-containing protein n=1 Tax=Porphyridium purpureum TaxID=35688 RepID=A0A5J4YXU2_PORPP|nr:putative exonuclease domain-containing protein [Porphyridium purpureum]|eukprot:POR2398..scf209_3